MSSSSSPFARPPATTGLVGVEARDYEDSPLKPAPLRLASKTKPSTPKLISRLSQNRREGQYIPPVQRTQVKTTAPSLASLASKFEIQGAKSSVDSKAPHRTLDATTRSQNVSTPTDSPVRMPEVPETRQVLAREHSSGSVSPLSRGSHSVRE